MGEHHVTIERRFRGPGGVGHGGYFSGLLARLVPGLIGVRIDKPIPLGEPLVVRASGPEDLEVFLGTTKIAWTAPPMPHLEVPDPVSYVVAAATRFCALDRDDGHPEPGCFGCGDRRSEGDGLRVHVGPAPGRTAGGLPLLAAAWTPHEAFFAGGPLPPEYVWAALDCPAGWALPPGKVSTGTIWARQPAPILAGGRYVVVGWYIPPDPSKSRRSSTLHAGSVIFDEKGVECASSRSVWVPAKSEALPA